MRGWLLALIGVLAIAAKPVAAHDTGFLDRVLIIDGTPRRYVVYVPAGAPATSLPLVLALHGAGERGDDGLVQTDVGLGHAIRRHPDRWRAVVVFPQAAAGSNWIAERRIALAALAAAAREFRTDPARVYAAGLSMGGNGVWALAHDDPRMFAAIVVVCGFAGPFHDFAGVIPDGRPDPFAALAHRLAPLPAWIVHGDADPVVPVADSRQMAAALRAAGADVHYRELPGIGHNAWDDAFADPDLPVWLFAQRRQ